MTLVPDLFLKTAVFLCVEEEADGIGRRIPKATGFLVRVDLEGTAYRVEYLVTARHCVQSARALGRGFWLRANTLNGQFVEVSLSEADWWESDDADVAACRIAQTATTADLPGGGMDVTGIRLDAFVGPAPDYRFEGSSPDIGPLDFQPRVGHEIYFPGLFTQHHGAAKNLPIVRFGHIAQMPNLVNFDNADGSTSRITAYLAEFQSWGGHSGSPVFFVYPQNVIREVVSPAGVTHLQADTAYIGGFLGVCSGHFNIPMTGRTSNDSQGFGVDLNSGIAIVTPAQAVKELLMRDDVVAERSGMAERLIRSPNASGFSQQ